MNFSFLVFVGCASLDGFLILFISSIGLGAPLGLFLMLHNLFCKLEFLISYFRGMFFLGWIFGFIYIFFWVGGSPRPVSYAPKFVLLTGIFNFLFSWDVLPWTDFLRFLIF